MATQKDLDKLRKQLSDLDAKLKSMRGNQKAPVARPPNFVDMGGDPSFEARMAFRNYANLRRDQKARLAAEQGQYTQGLGLQENGYPKAPPPLQQGQYTKGRLMGAPTEQQPEFGDIARQLPPQRSFDPNAPSLMPIRTPGSDALNQDLANRGMGGGIPAPIPQNPQMQTYNNLLQQGVQRSNTMNQGAMTDFANMQAGAPTTQPTIPSPQLGGVTAQPRGVLRPRQPKGFGSPIGRSAF